MFAIRKINTPSDSLLDRGVGVCVGEGEGGGGRRRKLKIGIGLPKST